MEFCVRRELAFISLTQTNRLHFDQTPNLVSCLRGGAGPSTKEISPRMFPPPGKLSPGTKSRLCSGISKISKESSPSSVRALSFLLRPSFQTEHKRNRRQRGKLANENTDGRTSEATVPGHGHGRRAARRNRGMKMGLIGGGAKKRPGRSVSSSFSLRSTGRPRDLPISPSTAT